MTGEVIGDLLRPLIGKSGTIFMVVSRSGQIGFATGPNRKLTDVEIREDGMVRLVHIALGESRCSALSEPVCRWWVSRSSAAG